MQNDATKHAKRRSGALIKKGSISYKVIKKTPLKELCDFTQCVMRKKSHIFLRGVFRHNVQCELSYISHYYAFF